MTSTKANGMADIVSYSEIAISRGLPRSSADRSQNEICERGIYGNLIRLDLNVSHR